MIDNPTGGRPFSPFGYCGSIKACNSAHGMLCSISSRNCSRFDFRPYFSNPVCAARVCCRTVFSLPLTPYPHSLWIGEYFRGSPKGDLLVFVDADTVVPGTIVSAALLAVQEGAIGGGPRHDSMGPYQSMGISWPGYGDRSSGTESLRLAAFSFVHAAPLKQQAGSTKLSTRPKTLH